METHTPYKACPECKHTLFHTDNIHQEISCRNCGLVLVAPPCYGFVFPGYVLLPRCRKIHFMIHCFNTVTRLRVEYNL